MLAPFITHADCARHEMGPQHPECPERLGAIRNEILVIAGTADALAGSAPGLAHLLANARGKQVAGCGHMDCLTQPMFKAAVMDFLEGIPG